MEETAEKLAYISIGSETISKNALKKMLKEQKKNQKEEEKRLKEEEMSKIISFRNRDKKNAENFAARVSSSEAQKTVSNDDETDPTKYYENRLAMISSLKASGKNPYPHMFEVCMQIDEYIQKFRNLADGDRLTDSTSIAGRIMNKRASSSKLFFYDLHGGGFKVQVMASAGDSELDEKEFSRYHGNVKRGDIVGISGYPGKSKRGELSIFPRKFVVLSPCLHMMPRQKEGPSADSAASKEPWAPGMPRNPETYILKDKETRYRQRYLDLILNKDVPKIFETRTNIIKSVRKFLDERGFREVETLFMNAIPGGAAAKPFVTHHDNLNMSLYMRIAPELFLKQLVVGMQERVYEIGKQFRNEGIDMTHNPEFTTCEFYKAHVDYNHMMSLTEELLSGMVKELTGGYKIKYHSNGYDKDPIEIDFTPPFRRLDMMEGLQTMANLSIIPTELASEEANEYLIDACAKFDVKCPPPQTTTRLLDKLVGHFLEETCVNPTFIINHPEIMSPLAKYHRSRPGLTERFELFINKHELCNGYTELNDPVVQRARFKEQLKDRQSGDDEAMAFDEAFCTALDFGLPPTGGCGIGIDRLVMLLTDSQNIKEVLLYPAMRPEDEAVRHLSTGPLILTPRLSPVQMYHNSVSASMEEMAEKRADLSTGSETIGKNAPKNELKELKEKQSELKKWLKEEENKNKAAQAASSKAQKTVSNDDELDPTKYYENRLAMIASLKASGKNPYPHMFEVCMQIDEYIQKFRNLADGDRLTDSTSIAGRIMNKRASSSKLFFYDLYGGGFEVQVMASAGDSELDEAEFSWYHGDYVKPGDIVGISGYPGKSKSGELSIFPRKFVVLSPCLRMWPPQKEGPSADSAASKEPWAPGMPRNPETYILKDKETRYRQRYLDLILNKDVPKIFETRTNLIKSVRKFLDERGFREVETPFMNAIPGGAAAKPFVTHHNDLNMSLYMRIAPELFLKQLVVGMQERVYEMGKQFRNECIDLTHNPEFTTCEFYKAHVDYNHMMSLTEELLSGMVKELTGGYKIKYHSNGYDKDPIEIDFTPPFRRLDMMEGLQTMANLSIIPTELASEEANEYLIDACAKFDVKCPPPQTTTRLLDKLVGHFLEETCVNPTFIINHPEIMSPLAKYHRSRPGLTEKFELFINKHELCNGYTELNDPVVQRARFKEQLKDRQLGDDEAMALDEAFCTALDFGLPPTGGCGIGIDRLVMLLTDSQNIKEVLLYPAMKPEDEHLTIKRDTH